MGRRDAGRKKAGLEREPRQEKRKEQRAQRGSQDKLGPRGEKMVVAGPGFWMRNRTEEEGTGGELSGDVIFSVEDNHGDSY